LNIKEGKNILRKFNFKLIYFGRFGLGGISLFKCQNKSKTWNEIWKDFKGLNWFGRRLKKEQRKALKKILYKIELPKDAKIIDIGCGAGFILAFFREFGYKNSVGIDNSKNSLKICEKFFNFKEGKDIFLMNARNIKFSNNSFDLVFSDGLLEHFEDFSDIAKEFCRISKSWILLFQPNQTSLFGKLKRFTENFMKVSWEKEYLYKKEDYVKTFSKFGFKLVDSGGINFNEQMWLLYKKEEHEN
jgi:ubiquinone/menaquinone biosynthesis C-methylase UbiE